MIDVVSEPGRGTTFKLYIPSVEHSRVNVEKERVDTPIVGGSETVLIAEDEDGVRNLIRIQLAAAGYTVLAARDGEEALRIFDEHAGAIDLAVLDVVMPKCGGREVMDYIQSKSPRTRYLFSSGYSESAIDTGFVINEGLRLIMKPYTRAVLLSAVREVLDAPPKS
jgi:CheY-like chemotaxis protein